MIWSSQKRSTFQPRSRSAAFTALSRAMLRSIFGTQNSRFDLMALAARVQLRPCQNDESQNTAILHRTIAKSGLPGTRLYCLRYLSPAAHKARPSSVSITDPELRTRDML